MKNTTPLEGYKNRHVDGLPEVEQSIQIIQSEGVFNGIWNPYDPHNYGEQKPIGLLGTFRAGGIGWNAWEQNDSEFVYYKII